MLAKKGLQIGCTLVLPLRTALAFLVGMEGGAMPAGRVFPVVLDLLMPCLFEIRCAGLLVGCSR